MQLTSSYNIEANLDYKYDDDTKEEVKRDLGEQSKIQQRDSMISLDEISGTSKIINSRTPADLTPNLSIDKYHGPINCD